MIVAIIPWGIHNTSQYLVLEYLYLVYVACGCTSPELDVIRPDARWVLELACITAIYYAQIAEINMKIRSTSSCLET
jgi:hypothetical protein